MQEKNIIIYKFSHYTKNGNGVYFINIFKCKENHLMNDLNYLQDHNIPHRKTKKGQAVDIQAITQLEELDPTAQFIKL